MLLKNIQIEREISLSTLDFSLESETLVNALNFACENDFYFSGVYPRYLQVSTCQDIRIT